MISGAPTIIREIQSGFQGDPSMRWARHASSVCEANPFSKRIGNPEQFDGDWTCRRTRRIASQARLPQEPKVSTLAARKDHLDVGGRSGRRFRRDAYLDVLMAHEPQTGAPVFSATPIPPEQRCTTHPERMQQHTYLTRLRGRAPIPLTLLAQRTRAAVANAGRIHHAQTAIGLSPPLLEVKRVSCWTAQRPIGLERKAGSGEATRFPGSGAGRGSIPASRRG